MATAAETTSKLGVGVLVWWKGNLKLIIVAGSFLYLFGELLLIAAPRNGHSTPLLITAEAFLAISRSSFDGVKEVALLHSAHLGHTAILLAMLSVCDKVGGMIGATIADGVWAAALPDAPKNYLSGEAILSAERVHPFLKDHLALAPGSEARLAIQDVYDTTQMYTLVAGIVAMVLAVLCALAVDDGNVLPSPSKPILRVPSQWKGQWDRRHRLRETIDVETQPNMCSLFEGLNRMLEGHADRLDTLWHRISEIVEDAAGCPQFVADDLLGLFLRTTASVWSLDETVSEFEATVRQVWARTKSPPEREPLLNVCCMNDGLSAAGFVHLHYPKNGVCVSAAYRSDGTAFLCTIQLPDTGKPNNNDSAETRHELEALSRALNFGVQKAFNAVDVTPPPSIAVAEKELLSKGTSQDNRSSLEQSSQLSLGENTDAATVQCLPRHNARVASSSHGQLSDCLYPDSRSWVHVHLPSYGMCWAFDWDGFHPYFPQRRVGSVTGNAVVGLTPAHIVRLRTALERCISFELGIHYSSRKTLLHASP